MSNTNYLNLDEVSSDLDVVLKFKGQEHRLEEPSVETFIANLKDLESLSINASPREEIELSIKMILRSFPTIKEKDLRSLKLTQLKSIGEFSRQASGQVAETGAEGDAEGNPPAAS